MCTSVYLCVNKVCPILEFAYIVRVKLTDKTATQLQNIYGLCIYASHQNVPCRLLRLYPKCWKLFR